MGYDDYEQGERVREWLRQNGVAIIAGIVIGLALIFGYRQWGKHKASENLDAANQYQLIQNAIGNGKTSEAETLTDSLLKNHADSTYAILAATLRARRELAAGKNAAAVTTLAWASKHAAAGPLNALTRLRLARAQLDAGKASDAIASLAAMPAGAYAGLVDELRGDAQVKLGHVDAASRAYQSALTAFDATSPQRHIVQMKIDNLAVTPAVKPASTKAAAAHASSSSKQDA
ncbi:MAG TPA: tetratricopeptide repeat protein [Rhodanobacteraceae bacterium]